MIFRSADFSDFGFYGYADRVGDSHDFFREANIFIQLMFRGVDHNGSKAAANAFHDFFEIRAVIQVQSHGHVDSISGGFYQRSNVVDAGVFNGSLRRLQNNRCTEIIRRLGNGLNDFHIVYIESADGIAVFVCML